MSIPEEKEQRTILDYPNYALIFGIIFIGLALASVSILFFTQYSNFGPNTGTIGDTIGGLTAPVFSLIGSILVFISFREQYIANRTQKLALDNEINRSNSNNQYNQITELITEIRNEINRLEFEHVNAPAGMPKHYIAFDTIRNLDKTVFDIDRENWNHSFWEHLILTLGLINFTLNKIDNYTYNPEEQQVLQIKMYNLLKLMAQSLNSYSFRLQNARYERTEPFISFIIFEKRITEFTRSTALVVLKR